MTNNRLIQFYRNTQGYHILAYNFQDNPKDAAFAFARARGFHSCAYSCGRTMGPPTRTQYRTVGGKRVYTVDTGYRITTGIDVVKLRKSGLVFK